MNDRKDLLTYQRLEAKIKHEIQELQISLKAKEMKKRKLTEKQMVNITFKYTFIRSCCSNIYSNL